MSVAGREVLEAAGRVDSLARAAAQAAGGDGAADARDALVGLVLHHVGRSLKSIEFIAKITGKPAR